MTAPAVTADVEVARILAPKPTYRLLVPLNRLKNATYFSMLGALLLSPFYESVSLWMAPMLALFFLVIWHTEMTRRRMLVLPGVIAIAAIVQLIIAPWLAYALPVEAAVLPMPVEPDVFFSYVAPAVFLMIAALYAPLWRMPLPPVSQPIPLSRAMRFASETMVFLGVPLRLASISGMPNGIRFLVLLIGNLAYVGAFTLAIARAPGWRWRMILVLVMEVVVQSVGAQFLEVIWWAGLAISVAIYSGKVRSWVIVAGGLAGMFSILALNGMKQGYRQVLRTETISTSDRPSMVAGGMATTLMRPDLVLSTQNIGLNISRFNEGWIIGHVMDWVPNVEPHAGGETFAAAARAAIFPRFLDADKAVAGGFEYFTRFSGLDLINGTSMNFGMVGEMYINYGRPIGLIGISIFGWCVGLILRGFVRLSRRTPLWWAWAPYVLVPVVSPELSSTEIFNHVTKAFIVAAAVAAMIPAWRRLWYVRPPRATGDAVVVDKAGFRSLRLPR